MPQSKTFYDLIYISVKNDVAFIIGNFMNLHEQQSSFCPVRELIYLARLYNAYRDMNKLNIYTAGVFIKEQIGGQEHVFG